MRHEMTSVDVLERRYAEETGCCDAVWLPSARAGVCWALQILTSKDTRVLAPAYTCSVVHEAVVRSGRSLRMLDSSAHDFLMDVETLRQVATPNSALILSEVFGHTYDTSALDREAELARCVRIIDMAMSLPEPYLGARLRVNDVAVISFGSGKSMFAGWGGIAFVGCRVLGASMRRLRDSVLTPASAGAFARRVMDISLRVLLLHPFVYACAFRIKKAQPVADSKGPLEPFPVAWSDCRFRTDEWFLGSTRIDRRLALWALNHAAVSRRTRLALSARYHQNLFGMDGIICPSPGSSALSHYSIRVDPHIRPRLQRWLLRAGINVLTLWVSPAYVDERLFPNAARRSLEVMNLPLTPWMLFKHVDYICQKLIEGMAACGAD